MKKHLISAMLAGVALVAAPQASAAKKDQAASGSPVQGIAVANLAAAISNSNAARTAAQQRPVTYKPQLDAYQARGQQIQAQLKPLYEKLERDSKAPNANRAALEQQAAAIQQIEENAQRELNEMLRPVAYSEAYVTEQIEEKMDASVKAVMAAKRVTVLLKPESVYVITDKSNDITQDILAEINRQVPTAQLVPPQGWEPRSLREARAAQAQQGKAPAAAPAPAAGSPTEGR